ncbi:MAG: DUF5916 domain-containing protein [Candidatus Aminicenantes bacterium]
MYYIAIIFLLTLTPVIHAVQLLENGKLIIPDMATILYKNLKNRLKLEVLPNFTYSRNVEREDANNWGENNISKNIGVSIKYGISSALTAEATINPDFSQVESDAFQVEVNQQKTNISSYGVQPGMIIIKISS